MTLLPFKVSNILKSNLLFKNNYQLIKNKSINVTFALNKITSIQHQP